MSVGQPQHSSCSTLSLVDALGEQQRHKHTLLFFQSSLCGLCRSIGGVVAEVSAFCLPCCCRPPSQHGHPVLPVLLHVLNQPANIVWWPPNPPGTRKAQVQPQRSQHIHRWRPRLRSRGGVGLQPGLWCCWCGSTWRAHAPKHVQLPMHTLFTWASCKWMLR